jgi:hypothetical protein
MKNHNSVLGFFAKKVLLFIFILFSFSAFCQNVSIEGKGKGIGGMTVRLYAIEDRLSFLELEKGRYVVEKNDSTFEFKLTLPSVTQLKIKIESYEFGFLAQPGKIYELAIGDFNYNIADSLNFFMHKIILPVEITNSDSLELTRRINDFDMVFENYLSQNLTRLLSVRNKSIGDTLNNFALQFVSPEDSSYFASYVRYEVAQVLYSTNLINRDKLRAELFLDKPILYSNIGYMDCFNLIYESYLTFNNRNIPYRVLDAWLETNNYDAMIDSLGVDTVLRNEVFRELVFLQGMKDAYFSKDFNSANVLRMLQTFIGKTKFAEHKIIASNLMQYLINKSAGMQVKDFVLKDVEENVLGFEKFRGKPLIISFVKLNDIESKRELETVFQLYDKIKDSCNSLTICCDKSLDAMYNFLKSNKVGIRYGWQFAHFDNNYDMLDAFNVRMFPTFVLLSADGIVLENPLRNPSDPLQSAGAEISSWNRFMKKKSDTIDK